MTPRKIRGVYEKLKGSGIWWIRYQSQHGIKREKVGRKSDAIALYAQRKTEVRAGKKLPRNLRVKGVTIKELAADTLVYSERHKRDYRTDVSRMKLILSTFGAREAASITPHEIDEFLANSRWKPATSNRYKALLSLVYRLAIRNGKLSVNPVRAVKPLKEENARIRFLSFDEEQRIMEVLEADHPHQIPAFLFSLETGLRLSSQFSCTWASVDVDRRQININRTKNGHPVYVPMSQTLTEALVQLKRRLGRVSGNQRIFLSKLGEPLNNPRSWWERALVKAGIEDYTWHCNRHTFISRLIMAGVDIRTAQEFAGHKTLSMTMRYAHLAPEHKREAIDKLDAFRRRSTADHSSVLSR